MHSTIFQISSEKISKEQFISELTFMECDSSFIDWCSTIDEAERVETLLHLIEYILPKGMFTLNNDKESITYVGGGDVWQDDWIKRIKEKANSITAENIKGCTGLDYCLGRLLLNPLDIDSRFVLSNYVSTLAEESAEFMKLVCELEPGAILYIGGMVDFHY